jgi:hypothetical protein
MFYNDWTIKRLADEHRRDLLCQAESERFARECVPQPHRWKYWLSWLGQQLIITGQRLQEHHKAAVTMAATSAALQAATERGCQTR